MNELVLKDFNGQSVRMHIDEGGNPWWEVSSLCDILGIDNASHAASRIDDEDKQGIVSNDDIGRRQEKICVNESGLYALVMGSRKPEAKSFKKWVTSEVLPSIRKTGQYVDKPKTMAEVALMTAQAVVDLEKRTIANEKRVDSLEVRLLTTVDNTQSQIDGIKASLVQKKVNQFPEFCMTLPEIADEIFIGITTENISTYLKAMGHPREQYQYTDEKGQLHMQEVFRREGLVELRKQLIRELQVTKTTAKNQICHHHHVGRFYIKIVSHMKNAMAIEMQ